MGVGEPDEGIISIAVVGDKGGKTHSAIFEN